MCMSEYLPDEAPKSHHNSHRKHSATASPGPRPASSAARPTRSSSAVDASAGGGSGAGHGGGTARPRRQSAYPHSGRPPPATVHARRRQHSIATTYSPRRSTLSDERIVESSSACPRHLPPPSTASPHGIRHSRTEPIADQVALLPVSVFRSEQLFSVFDQVALLPSYALLPVIDYVALHLVTLLPIIDQGALLAVALLPVIDKVALLSAVDRVALLPVGNSVSSRSVDEVAGIRSGRSLLTTGFVGAGRSASNGVGGSGRLLSPFDELDEPSPTSVSRSSTSRGDSNSSPLPPPPPPCADTPAAPPPTVVLHVSAATRADLVDPGPTWSTPGPTWSIPVRPSRPPV